MRLCWQRIAGSAGTSSSSRWSCTGPNASSSPARWRKRSSAWRRCQPAPQIRWNEPTVACLRVDLYTTLDQSSRAIAVGLDYLRHLGIDWSPHPTEEEARREYERIWSQLGSRTIEELIDLPLMSDPASLATLDVLTKLGPPALLYGCEPAFPGHLPSGQSQPRARQLRRFVLRLCRAWHDRRPALRRLPGRISLRSARL